MNYLSLLYFISASFLYQLTACTDQSKPTTSSDPTTRLSASIHANNTTFIFVRHTEKDTVKGDPILTKAGMERAIDLSHMLADLPITAVYSTDFKRTKQTAQPTATAKGLEINIYNHRELEATAKEIFSKHSEGVILVVGHSNSTPNFINLLLGEKKIEQIDESDYDNLFIVQAKEIASAEVLHLHYGKHD